MIQVAILDRHLSQGHAQPGVGLPRSLNHFRLGCPSIERRGGHEQDFHHILQPQPAKDRNPLSMGFPLKSNSVGLPNPCPRGAANIPLACFGLAKDLILWLNRAITLL